jgi:hypothetical protein
MPAKFDRCVRKVKGKVKNPYAVCKSVMKKSKRKKRK